MVNVLVPREGANPAKEGGCSESASDRSHLWQVQVLVGPCWGVGCGGGRYLGQGNIDLVKHHSFVSFY